MRGMVKILRIVCLLLSVVVFSGCATEGGRPDVSVPKKRLAVYPESEYLTAEGIGRSETEAKSRALSELSRIFRARVVSETSDSMISLYSENEGKKSESFTQEVKAKVRVTSGVAFEGVRTEDTWFDETGKRYHALAVLNRAEAHAAWVEKIKELDDRVRAELLAIEGVQSRFLLFRGYRRIEKLWLERTIYTSRIRVIGGTVPALDYDIGEILANIARIRSEITISFDLTGDGADVLQYEIAGTLMKAGFKVTPDREAADILISGQISVNHLDMKNPGWSFAGAEAGVVLMDLKTGKDVGSISGNSRSAHLEFIGAARRALRKVSKDISDKLILLFK